MNIPIFTIVFSFSVVLITVKINYSVEYGKNSPYLINLYVHIIWNKYIDCAVT